MHKNEQTELPPDDQSGQEATTWRILEAVGYLNQCRASQRGLAILTGSSSPEIRLVLKHFLVSLDDPGRIARILAPTDSCHAFLEAILAQLGLDPFESSTDDLQRLLHVVLRQGASQNTTTVILIEDAHQFGPRVLELVRELIRGSRTLEPPPLFVLTGRPALHRVLDSKGMASVSALTRLRFDLAACRPAPVAAATPDSGQHAGRGPGGNPDPEPCLILSLGAGELARFPIREERLLIGRGEHCDIPILSRFVSRQHALFLRNASGDWIIDLKSTNGTSVNSVLARQRQLAHGDVISIGNHRLLYHHPAARSVERAPEPRNEQLGETLVMRSLQAVVQPVERQAG